MVDHMADVEPTRREVTFHIVYWGPGLSGKHTSVDYICARASAVTSDGSDSRRFELRSLPQCSTLPNHHGMQMYVHLHIPPLSLAISAERRALLERADAFVFVADSQYARREANIVSLHDLRADLAAAGRDIDEVALVLQYNKRDLPGIMTLDELRADLNPERSLEDVESCAVAQDTTGVVGAFQLAITEAITDFLAHLHLAWAMETQSDDETLGFDVLLEHIGLDPVRRDDVLRATSYALQDALEDAGFARPLMFAPPTEEE